ncbi:MAG: hypothetical protein P8M30_05765 [Planctomycetaceae bacterium]|nr:hypothetical protein [Planctomycetaceae bacterium]
MRGRDRAGVSVAFREKQSSECVAPDEADYRETFQNDPAGGESIPNWSRVITVFPDFPQRLREAVAADAVG